MQQSEFTKSHWSLELFRIKLQKETYNFSFFTKKVSCREIYLTCEDVKFIKNEDFCPVHIYFFNIYHIYICIYINLVPLYIYINMYMNNSNILWWYYIHTLKSDPLYIRKRKWYTYNAEELHKTRNNKCCDNVVVDAPSILQLPPYLNQGRRVKYRCIKLFEYFIFKKELLLN